MFPFACRLAQASLLEATWKLLASKNICDLQRKAYQERKSNIPATDIVAAASQTVVFRKSHASPAGILRPGRSQHLSLPWKTNWMSHLLRSKEGHTVRHAEKNTPTTKKTIAINTVGAHLLQRQLEHLSPQRLPRSLARRRDDQLPNHCICTRKGCRRSVSSCGPRFPGGW